jgi:hypothetical protein
MSVNIISELPTLYRELEENFEAIFTPLKSKTKINGGDYSFQELFNQIIHPLLKLGLFKNATLFKQDSVGTYDDFTWIQMYKFEVEKPYFVIVATYVGSCYGCLHRYVCHCSENNSVNCQCDSKIPNTIKTKSEAFDYFRSRFLDCFKNIVSKATVVENETDASDLFLEIKDRVFDDEQALKRYD